MAAHQAPLSLGFSRQAYWSGLPFPSPMHACMLGHFSRIQLCATPWTEAYQASLSTGFSRQEYWSGLPFPSPISRVRLHISYYSGVGRLFLLSIRYKDFLKPYGFITATPSCYYNPKVAVDNPCMSNCIPIRVHVWTLKSGFCINKTHKL